MQSTPSAIPKENCVASITEALEVMRGEPARVIDYGVSDEAAWEVGLACGGKVEILIEDLTA